MNRTRGASIVTGTAAAALLLGLPTMPAARAQQAATTTTTTTSTSEIETITVTARRRSEALQEVPVTVTAFSAKDLESAGVEQPSDFLNITPGVFFRSNTTAGTSFINIRGITESRNAESPVAIVVDGVYLNNPLDFQNALVDLKQIEVLKGPQGALYGRNASAGAILITTDEPTDEYHGYVKGGFGRHNQTVAEAGFGGPIIEDKLLFRVTGFHHSTDGYLKNTYLSQGQNAVYGDYDEDNGARARLLFLATDDLTFDTRFSYSQTHTGFNNTIFDPTNEGSADIINKIPYEPNQPGVADRTIYDFSEKIDFNTRFGTLTSISAYNNTKERSGGDSLPYSPSLADGTQWLINEYETESQEVRFTSPDKDRFRWIVGGYWQHTARGFGSSAGTDKGTGILIIDRTGATSGSDSVNPAKSISFDAIDQTSWAIFGQVAYDILDNLELSAALRYDRDDETDTDRSPTRIDNEDGSFYWVGGPSGRTRDVAFNRPQPKITLKYKPTETDNIYVTYAEGFKNGGFNPSSIPVPSERTFAKEVTKTWEVGYKGSFLENRLNLDLSGYYSEVRGVNYFDFIIALENQLNLNIDKVRIYGVELAATARVTPELTVVGSVSPIDNTIEADAALPSAVGHRAPAFPDLTANLTVDWEHEIKPGWAVFARGDYQYVGSVAWDLQEHTVREPLNLLDLRAGVIYGDKEAPLRVELYCRNCTNLDYVNEGVVLANGAIGTVDFYQKDHLEYGVEVTKRF